MYQPLADWIRPTALDDVVGQEHILGSGAVLRRLIDSGNIPNLIFYGPSGTGKTTVANIIAQRTRRKLYRLNATTASTSDIKDIVAQLDTLMAPDGVLLYLDEIQSFNKKQQQSLLEHIENGKITLIASTTENPYFYIFNAILSRSTIFEFKQLTPQAVRQAMDRAVAAMAKRSGLTVTAEEGAMEYVAAACGGDLRKALNAVEVLFSAADPKARELTLTLADAKAVAQRSAMRYDRDGDNHYDLLSALQKSIRGSDPDAAVHYLARLLEAGDMISACRRLMVIACEDAGDRPVPPGRGAGGDGACDLHRCGSGPVLRGRRGLGGGSGHCQGHHGHRLPARGNRHPPAGSHLPVPVCHRVPGARSCRGGRPDGLYRRQQGAGLRQDGHELGCGRGLL